MSINDTCLDATKGSIRCISSAAVVNVAHAVCEEVLHEPFVTTSCQIMTHRCKCQVVFSSLATHVRYVVLHHGVMEGLHLCCLGKCQKIPSVRFSRVRRKPSRAAKLLGVTLTDGILKFQLFISSLRHLLPIRDCSSPVAHSTLLLVLLVLFPLSRAL